ncbi:MAG: 23S rRNA (adenine(2030)-N(6))-methyltransferase RlmJ [Treponema sp.]|nr:23S rRNA (adenine(2030)-N(6))-methyltransferase RlmJ [Candidatus Treponema caballi]
MLSYRHAFHAGNHADILKHALLTLALQSLQKKDKPYTLVDTHAGAGLYVLDDERAEKTGETKEGIVHLLDVAAAASESGLSGAWKDDVPASLKPYLELCRGYAAQGKYPGSPEIMARNLRSQDKLMLIELHNTEIDVLRVNMKKSIHDGRLGIHHRNAFEAVDALLPPDPRRGLLLMDPSYEVDSDWTNTADALVKTHRRWPVGVLCLWYPLLQHRESEIALLKASLREAAAATPSSFLCAELLVDSPEREAGLYGSGMMVINPPWHLDEQLKEMLPYLSRVLTESGEAAGPGKGSWSVELEAV